MITEEKIQQYTLDGVMIGKRTRDARKEKGYTQEELAEKCGCRSPHISNIENGKIGVSLDLLYVLSIVLDKSMDYFVMDGKGANPQIKIETKISPKLVKCDTEMLEIVDNFLDRLITYRDSVTHEIVELKKKYGIG